MNEDLDAEARRVMGLLTDLVPTPARRIGYAVANLNVAIDEQGLHWRVDIMGPTILYADELVYSGRRAAGPVTTSVGTVGTCEAPDVEGLLGQVGQVATLLGWGRLSE